MKRFLFVLLALGSLTGAASCYAISKPFFGTNSSKPSIQIDDNTTPNQLLRAMELWPICILKKHNIEINCHSWQEKDIEYRITGIKGELGYVPVIQSYYKKFETSNKYLIHMTGGPAGVPYASKFDSRSDALNIFMKKGFKIVSIGYWGSRFRTIFKQNEINFAAKDFQSVYDFYSEKNYRSPLVVAESLGAHILFQSLHDYKYDDMYFIAVSPAMLGLKEANSHFNKTMDARALKFNSKLSYLYKYYENNPSGMKFQFQSGKLINTSEHFDKFAKDVNTIVPLDINMHECSKIIIGKNDPLNLMFLNSNYEKNSRLMIIDAGHDIYKDNIVQSVEIFENFVACNK